MSHDPHAQGSVAPAQAGAQVRMPGDDPRPLLRPNAALPPSASMRHLEPEFEAMKRRFPPGFESSLTLPCLRRIQEERGYVAEDDIAWLTGYLGVPRVQIEEVLSFYTQFRRAPVGRWLVQVCRNVSCSMRGGERVLDHLQRRLGVPVGGTTADGRYTLATVECLGSCGTAPVVMINDGYHEAASAPQLDALLDSLA